jgi:peptide/nickel transport system permease protein
MSLGAPRNSRLLAGAALTVIFLVTALIAQFWTPYDPGTLSIVDKLQAPNWRHWFGTDQLGRDVLSMVMAGAKNSVGVALALVAATPTLDPTD